MASKTKLREINFFDEIIDINKTDPKNIKVDEKSYRKIHTY